MVDKNHILGIGETVVSAGYDASTKTPWIKLEQMEQPMKIGKNLLDEPVYVLPGTRIVVKNLEGLAILEEAIKHVKKQLKSQNKIKK